MNQDHTIPDWKLERYVLGELPDQELEAIRSRAESDNLLRARVQAIETSDSDLRSEFPTTEMADRIRERASSSPPHPARPIVSARWLLATLPAAAAILLFLLPQDNWSPVSENRIKGGGPALYLYRKTSEGVEELRSGSIAREHDLIQIKYRSGSQRYGVILSIDGRGTITVHLPESGTRSAELTLGKSDTLSFAYELDDAPSAERFYFISSDHSFDVQLVRNAAKAMASNPREAEFTLPESFEQSVFTLEKDSDHAN